MVRFRFFAKLAFILCILCNEISNVSSQYSNFSTKTSYRYFENDLNIDNVRNYPGCEPVKLWMLIRHGTRLPRQNLMYYMINKLPFIRNIILEDYSIEKGKLNSEELIGLSEWNFNITKDDAENMLVTEGKWEMSQLGKRTKERFENLLNFNISNSVFKSAASTRTIESAGHFAEGLFDNTDSEVDIQVLPDNEDHILNFDDSCESWMKNVKHNSKTYYEHGLYVRSREMQRALVDVSYRMGASEMLAFNFIKPIYDVCAYETAWNPNADVSPWCALFSNSSLNAFEYADDLEHYWRDGYGNNINKRMPCKLFQELFNFFESDNKAGFYFTHAGVILKTLTFLGLNEPVEDLMHDNRDANRLWQTSKICPFGANIAFILYKCEDQMKFLLMHQEKPIRLLECGLDDLCPLKILRNRYELNKCKLDLHCKNH